MTPELLLEAAPLDPASLPTPVWIVAPHPDDEALGCGGLIAALTGLGREVRAMLLTDGGFSHPTSRRFPRARLAGERLREWRTGLAALGVPAGHTHALGFPDGALEGCDPAVFAAAFRQTLALSAPGTVVLPWARDPHPDHRAASRLCRAALPSGANVLEYPVWLAERGDQGAWPRPGEVQAFAFDPQPWQSRKRRAIAAHRTQLGLITDDPRGFTLPPAMIERALESPEYFFRRPAGLTTGPAQDKPEA